MIIDSILTLIYGMFDYLFQLLPIPEIPDWYLTEIYPVMVIYLKMAVKMISFLFPSNLWSWLITYTETMLIIRITYDLYKKFHPLHTSVS